MSFDLYFASSGNKDMELLLEKSIVTDYSPSLKNHL